MAEERDEKGRIILKGIMSIPEYIEANGLDKNVYERLNAGRMGDIAVVTEGGTLLIDTNKIKK